MPEQRSSYIKVMLGGKKKKEKKPPKKIHFIFNSTCPPLGNNICGQEKKLSILCLLGTVITVDITAAPEWGCGAEGVGR